MRVGATQADIDRGDRTTLRIIAIAAGAVGLALAIAQFASAATTMWAAQTTVTLLARVELPVSRDGSVIRVGVETVSVVADGLDSSTRLLLASGAVLLGVTAAIVTAMLSWMLWATASGRPFRPALRRFALAAGATLLIGPLLATSLSGFGSMEAAAALNADVDDILIVGFGFSAWGLALPLVGLGVMCLGVLFQRLERLERDTEGLV